MAVKKVKKSATPQAGFKGRVTSVTYSHGVKLGLPSYSSIEMRVSVTAELDPSDDPDVVMEMLKNRVHREIAQTSEERKQTWLEELGEK